MNAVQSNRRIAAPYCNDLIFHRRPLRSQLVLASIPLPLWTGVLQNTSVNLRSVRIPKSSRSCFDRHAIHYFANLPIIPPSCPSMIYGRSTYVSVLTIVAFTMERFLAICHPLHLYTMSGFKRAIRIIAALWCISFLSAIPFAVHTKIYYAAYPLGECIYDELFSS